MVHVVAVNCENLVANMKLRCSISAWAYAGNETLVSDHLHTKTNRRSIRTCWRQKKCVRIVQFIEESSDDPVELPYRSSGVDLRVILKVGGLEVKPVILRIKVIFCYIFIGLTQDNVSMIVIYTVEPLGLLTIQRDR